MSPPFSKKLTCDPHHIQATSERQFASFKKFKINIIFINLLLALVALSLGTLLSAFAATEFQMMQFIPIIVVPQIFFSGIFSMEGMPLWLQTIGRILPMTYAADALKRVMYEGALLTQVGGDLLVLVAFALVFIVLNIFALKKYRTL